MKKVYVFFLLAANVISLSAAECQRRKTYENNYQDNDRNDALNIPLNLFTATTTAPLHQNDSSSYYWLHSSYLEVNQPGWEILDDIANMTYKRDQIPLAHIIEPTPVYTQTNQYAHHRNECEAPLLLTNSLKPDSQIMKKLCDEAFGIIYELCHKKPTQKDQNKTLVRFINYMNNARNKGIHEDLVGQLAYRTKDDYFMGDDDLSPIPSLLFTLLKKYTLTVSQTGEQLPLHLDAKKSQLKEIIATPSDTSTHNAASDITNVYADLAAYPAFTQLSYALRHALQELPIESIHIFTDYVYGNSNVLLQDYSLGSYTQLKNEFYTQAYNLLLHNGSAHDLYLLIQMIDKAKNSKELTNEDELATGILGFEPNQPIRALLCSLFHASHDVGNVKKRVAVFCALAKKYNNTRLAKTTPTSAQYHAYLVTKSLDIPLSSPLLNENLYALAEFNELFTNTKILMDSSENKINQCLEQEPQKKTT